MLTVLWGDEVAGLAGVCTQPLHLLLPTSCIIFPRYDPLPHRCSLEQNIINWITPPTKDHQAVCVSAGRKRQQQPKMKFMWCALSSDQPDGRNESGRRKKTMDLDEDNS